jgi:hypothetical protein
LPLKSRSLRDWASAFRLQQANNRIRISFIFRSFECSRQGHLLR